LGKDFRLKCEVKGNRVNKKTILQKKNKKNEKPFAIKKNISYLADSSLIISCNNNLIRKISP